MKAILYHNNRCSKSREALAILTECGADFEIKEYLKFPPTKEELLELLEALQLAPIDIIRKVEPTYRNNYQGKRLTNDEWIQVMIDNPVLIERPIIIKDGKAAIGRPPVLVKDVF